MGSPISFGLLLPSLCIHSIAHMQYCIYSWQLNEEEKTPHFTEKETSKATNNTEQSWLRFEPHLSDPKPTSFVSVCNFRLVRSLLPGRSMHSCSAPAVPWGGGCSGSGALVQNVNPRPPTSEQVPDLLPRCTSCLLFRAQSLTIPQMGHSVSHGKEILLHRIVLWKYHCGSV